MSAVTVCALQIFIVIVMYVLLLVVLSCFTARFTGLGLDFVHLFMFSILGVVLV